MRCCVLCKPESTCCVVSAAQAIRWHEGEDPACFWVPSGSCLILGFHPGTSGDREQFIQPQDTKPLCSPGGATSTDQTTAPTTSGSHGLRAAPAWPTGLPPPIKQPHLSTPPYKQAAAALLLRALRAQPSNPLSSTMAPCLEGHSTCSCCCWGTMLPRDSSWSRRLVS